MSQSEYQINNFQWSQNSRIDEPQIRILWKLRTNGLDWSKHQLSHSRASVSIFDTTISEDATKQNQPQNSSQLLARCRRKLSWPTLRENFSRRSGSIKKILCCVFYHTQVWSMPGLVINSLIHCTVETSLSLKGCVWL